jgi:hypothetical protein
MRSSKFGWALTLALSVMGSAAWGQVDERPWQPMTNDAAAAAISQFRTVGRDNGLAGGLRTFARNGDFHLYLNDQTPADLGQANQYFSLKAWRGEWQEFARGRSADSTLAFAEGEFAPAKGVRYHYTQVWQFDPKVANWGLKVLSLKLAAPANK